MPRRVPLPPELTLGPFSVSLAHSAKIGEGRLRGADLIAPFHGVRELVRPEGDRRPIVEACRQFVPVMLPTHFFSHLTAAHLWGCPITTPRDGHPLHVSSFAPHSPPRRPGITGHELKPGSVRIVRRHGLRVADPASTLLQLAAIVPLDEFVVAGDYLIQDPPVLDPSDIRPHTTLEALHARIDSWNGRGRRAALAALALMRVGAESRMETLLCLLLHRAGFPDPAVNPWITGIRRRWRHRADLVYLDRRVIVEYDGDHHRTDTRQYEIDMRRFDDFVHDGWQLVRVRKYGVLENPADTVERVHSALTVGGRTPA